MASARKLQAEVERIMKRIGDGISTFDGLWDKLHDPDLKNSNQKEKIELDLKKEVKKLQKYRDQVKQWCAGHEIKDKTALMNARRAIEQEMERFKACEKEAKTKAFSKEGLQQQALKLDPREKAKQETREWLNGACEQLTSQIEEFEAELEGLGAKKGKQPSPRSAHLQESVRRHKEHIGHLEALLRMVDNESIKPEDVDELRDMIEDYGERNQADFDEFCDIALLYGDLLDEVEGFRQSTVDLQKIGLQETHSLPSQEVEDENKEVDKKAGEESEVANQPQAEDSGLPNRKTARIDKEGNITDRAPKVVDIKRPTSHQPIHSSAPPTPHNQTKAFNSPLMRSVPPSSRTSFVPPSPRNYPTMGSRIVGGPPSVHATPTKQVWTRQVRRISSSQPSHYKPSFYEWKDPRPSPIKRDYPYPNAEVSRLKLPTPVPSDCHQPASAGIPAQDVKGQIVNPSGSVGSELTLHDQYARRCTELSKSEVENALSSAASGLSTPSDLTCTSTRDFPPKWPTAVPASFPKQVPESVDLSSTFRKMDLDTLFFVFYNQVGTRRQYLAAKELKRKSWRFHKRYGAWFQRHNEPRVMTSSFEQGSYVYFDHQVLGGRGKFGQYDTSVKEVHEGTGQSKRSSGWCQRLKYDFIFEYSQLEDEA